MTLLDINLLIGVSGAARSSDEARWTVHHARNMKKRKEKRKGDREGNTDVGRAIMLPGL